MLLFYMKKVEILSPAIIVSVLAIAMFSDEDSVCDFIFLILDIIIKIDEKIIKVLKKKLTALSLCEDGKTK